MRNHTCCILYILEIFFKAYFYFILRVTIVINIRLNNHYTIVLNMNFSLIFYFFTDV
ncbi:hypothetical protein C1645_782301 [Glomus cerebriforme]|uniref:Uncharacterized protein n=1 Tax=Glomus cerebriforme TaxID=658196 RepID=A0A397SRE5_9GLOM|nr:hypothetical protein C1645_782301 [Glomus cerebriforme]